MIWLYSPKVNLLLSDTIWYVKIYSNDESSWKGKVKTFYWSIFSWFYLIGGEGEYGQVYNWSESGREETEKALEGGFAGRPDLQEWLDDRRAHFEAILERYSRSDPATSEGGQSLVRESDQAYYGSFEGNPLVKHDLGEDYGRENLAELAESIDGVLDQIRPVTVGKDQGSDAGRPTRNLKLGLGDDAVLAAKGWSVLGDDPHLWGYDGTEHSPTVDGDWKQFRKIDFKGTRVKGATGYPWLSHYSLCYLNETTCTVLLLLEPITFCSRG